MYKPTPPFSREGLTNRLDELERKLPSQAAALVRIQRAIARAAIGVTTAASRSLLQALDALRGHTSASIDTIRGTTPGVDEYASWTKAELYARARELDIEGRSTMNKDDLIEALRAN